MTTEPKPLVPCDLCGEMEPADTCAQIEPKPLDLPPMPNEALYLKDSSYIRDLEIWGRQLADIAQAQAALADGLAEALRYAETTFGVIELNTTRGFKPHRLAVQGRKYVELELAKYLENRR